MGKEIKVLVVGGADHYAKVLEKFKLVKDIAEANLVIFTGGEDVDPALYGEKAHSTTHFNVERDTYEKTIFDLASEKKIPMLGICRGSQFLTVMNGGKLIQHVTGHNKGDHEIIILDPEFIGLKEKEEDIIQMSSTHHQMMYPYSLDPDDYHIIAFSEKDLSNVYWKNNLEQYSDEEEELEECEIVFYKKTKCLAIQGHPESMLDNHLTTKAVRAIIETYLFCEIDWDYKEDSCLTQLETAEIDKREDNL